jgi:hypothetical protein
LSGGTTSHCSLPANFDGATRSLYPGPTIQMLPLGTTYACEENAANLTALPLTLRQSCVEPMADYRVHVTPQKWRVEPAPSLTAEVDFKGRLLYGSVVLSATRRVVRETAQEAAGMHAGAPRSLSDWNRELANQLLGRVKSKLLTQEVSVDVGVPRPLVTAEPTLDDDLRQRFSCAAGSFSLQLVATFDALVLGVGSSDERPSKSSGPALAWSVT